MSFQTGVLDYWRNRRKFRDLVDPALVDIIKKFPRKLFHILRVPGEGGIGRILYFDINAARSRSSACKLTTGRDRAT